MRVLIKTLGCRLNEAEAEQWARGFLQRGHQLAHDVADADLVVLNSCAVTGDAARKSRGLIRRVRRDNPLARVVVSGCYATLSADPVRNELGVDLVVSNSDKSRLVEITERELALTALPAAAPVSALFQMGRQRAFVKVQDGCRHRCTFCIVTIARGEERSRSLDEITAEIQRLCEAGVQEAVLTGVHLGGYGHDLGSDLATLIESVLARTSLPRLRLGSLEPWDLPDGFFDLFANPRLLPHLHLPLQSGSDAVLKRMARRCRSSEFRELAAQARDRATDLNLTTDIIVGFPGETAEDFAHTLEMVEEIGFGHVHIFTYSARAGTAAAALPSQVPEPVKKERSAQLHALAARCKRRTLERFVGRRFEVLWEGEPTQDRETGWRFSGYTPNYLRVSTQTPAGCLLTNRITPVRITAVDGDGLIGTAPSP